MAKKIMFNDRYGLTEAVLSGRKTMTRRIIKSKNIIARHWNPSFNADHCYYTDGRGKCQLIDTDTNKIIIPQFKVGEVVAIAMSYKDVVEHTHTYGALLGTCPLGEMLRHYPDMSVIGNIHDPK